MNVGTPVVYVDEQGNEWAGKICGRTWDHFQPRDPKTNQPDGPVVRNEDGNFNVACINHDGQPRYVQGVPPSALTVADLSDGLPVFATRAVNAAVSASVPAAPPAAAPAEIDYDKLAAAMARQAKPRKATK